MAKIESRCGTLCETCSFQKTTGCKGCVNIENPFWGNCPLKSCCEGKKYAHCGECPAFACQTLTEFAYDPEHGDNGLRLDQCKKWREEA